jgi:Phage integrase, N-terminal SAM-like domain
MMNVAGGELARSLIRRKYDAEAWLTAQEASKLDNAWTDPARGCIRFADWATEWWQDWSPGKAPATLEATESHLRLHIRPYFDCRQLNTIDAQVVQRWQNELAGRVGHELLMAYRSILNRILEAAKVNRHIPINPSAWCRCHRRASIPTRSSAMCAAAPSPRRSLAGYWADRGRPFHAD